jgi:hypothetical protein
MHEMEMIHPIAASWTVNLSASLFMAFISLGNEGSSSAKHDTRRREVDACQQPGGGRSMKKHAKLQGVFITLARP